MTLRIGGAQSVPKRQGGRLVVMVVLGIAAVALVLVAGRPWVTRLVDTFVATRATGDEAGGADVDSLVASRARDLESEMRARMESELETMRRQVAEAERAAAARGQRDLAPPPPRRAESPRRPRPRPPIARRSVERRPPPRPPAKPRALPHVGSSLSRASSPPRPLTSLNPRIPAGAASDRRVEVMVPVRVWIDERGAVSRATLRRPTDRVFDELALQAARDARFVPATANGAPTASSVTLFVHLRR